MKKLKDFAESPPAVSAEVCAYAAQMIKTRMERMLAEAKQAKRGRRTEAIHQMRVWSRRSRAALEMFAPCFSGRHYAAVALAVHDVTGALGAARDLDVMILTLRDRANALPDAERAGLFAFVKVLEARREAAQEPVSFAVKKLKRQNAAQFAALLTESPAAPSRTRGKRKASGSVDLSAALTANAAHLITKRLHTLFEYETCLDDAGAVTQHHAMRIAAKKLRYTMDIFQEAVTTHLPDAAPFVNALEAVKRLQEHLGEMHDADVLAPQLAEYLAKMLRDGYATKAKSLPKFGVDCVSFDACAGIVTLCQETAARRASRFTELKREWETIQTDGVFDSLIYALQAAQYPAPVEWTLPETPVLEIVVGAEPLETTPAVEAVETETYEQENSHEEARIEPVTADGSRPVARNVRVRRAPAAPVGGNAPAADADGHSEPGADSPAGAAKSRVSKPARTETGEPE